MTSAEQKQNFSVSFLASLPQKKRDHVYSNLTDEKAALIIREWKNVARPEQRAPEGECAQWLFLAGRGAGKTRSGARLAKRLHLPNRIITAPLPEGRD